MFATILLMSFQLLTTNSLELIAQSPPNPAGRGGRSPEQPAQPSEEQPGRRGGEPGPAEPAAPELLRVYPLKYLGANDVCQMVHAVFGRSYLYPIEQTNSVLYNGPEEMAPKIEGLISQLDTSAAGEEVVSEERITLVPIKHRDAGEIASELARIHRPDVLVAVYDHSRNAVLLKGEKDAIDKAESIIVQLDTPSPMVELEFAFFKAKQYGEGAAADIPDDLQDVAKELRRFGRLELLGRLSTLAVQEQKFQIRGHVSDMLTAEVQGHVLSATSDTSAKLPFDGSAKIAFEARMDLQRPEPEPQTQPGVGGGQARRQSRPPEFFLNTVVTTKRGDRVILGSAPHGWEAGESAILVMTVRE